MFSRSAAVVRVMSQLEMSSVERRVSFSKACAKLVATGRFQPATFSSVVTFGLFAKM